MSKFLLGVAIGFFIGGVVAVHFNNTVEQYHKQKTLCEQSLPRNQVCEMRFVPKED